MSIRRYLVPKRDIVQDLEKIVPLSIAKAVRKEVESTAAEQSGSVAMGSMKRGQYDKTITETQKAKIAGYAAENGIATANASSLLLLSRAQPSFSPMKGVHTSL